MSVSFKRQMELRAMWVEQLHRTAREGEAQGMPSPSIHNLFIERVMRHPMWKKVPFHSHEFIKGYWQALHDAMWQKVEFMCLWEGKAYKWNDAPQECKDKIMSRSGDEWKGYQSHVWTKFLPEIRRFT